MKQIVPVDFFVVAINIRPRPLDVPYSVHNFMYEAHVSHLFVAENTKMNLLVNFIFTNKMKLVYTFGQRMYTLSI